jgi:hypothetical protein
VLSVRVVPTVFAYIDDMELWLKRTGVEDERETSSTWIDAHPSVKGEDSRALDCRFTQKSEYPGPNCSPYMQKIKLYLNTVHWTYATSFMNSWADFLDNGAMKALLNKTKQSPGTL